jgi:hypothetical protein
MPSAKPWRGWYHVNGNTYGTWLPGDPRGWRERRHRKHVDGDYKKPPRAGTGDGLHGQANSMLVHPPVHLQKAQSQTAGRALVEMILHQEVELLTLSLDDVHFHLLGRFRDRDVRPKVGRAKKHAYHELREIGFQGKLWGMGSNVVPITDRRHQLNVFEYITRHEERGAWLWTFRQGLYWGEGE